MILALICLVVFTSVTIFAIRWVIAGLLQKEADALNVIKEQYDESLSIKTGLEGRKKVLETEVAQIFTLYDLTREMTKNFSEEKTFQTFKSKLAQNVNFKECVLLDPLAEENIDQKDPHGYLLLTLTGQRRKLGILALSGVAEDQKEKVAILANQFALALRRVRLYQDIERLAITDSLTEVHTRRYLMERFEEERNRAMAHKTKMSFLMIDVDHFKSYNDQHGHLTGDQILREIAGIIKAHIREIDIIGRYGGEEFCVVLPDTDHDGAGYVAERIRSAVQGATIKAYDTKTKATLSIGISVYPHDGKKVNELIDKADWALYRAKKEGRNRICAFGVYTK
ncbi:MAG: GGDEF domain-containing protein [Candidatus Omnitrophica bacterium]|nr:GGDEF domain-containing protein [Candidatus Omnitrophota bacterium]